MPQEDKANQALTDPSRLGVSKSMVILISVIFIDVTEKTFYTMLALKLSFKVVKVVAMVAGQMKA